MSAAGEPIFERLLRNASWLLGANGVTVVVGIAQGIIATPMVGVDGYE
jgi:O-antigen/teichoic acid export membrane protein